MIAGQSPICKKTENGSSGKIMKRLIPNERVSVLKPLFCIGLVFLILIVGCGTITAASSGKPDTPAVVPTLVSTSEVPVTATATATGSDRTTHTAQPLSAPAADDPILGTWTGTKSVSLFFVSANGQGTVTFRDDFTGDLSGAVHGAGMNETFASGFVWMNNGGGSYTGSIGTESMDVTLAGDTLTMTINPKKLGLNAMLDMDIPVEMHRV